MLKAAKPKSENITHWVAPIANAQCRCNYCKEKTAGALLFREKVCNKVKTGILQRINATSSQHQTSSSGQIVLAGDRYTDALHWMQSFEDEHQRRAWIETLYDKQRNEWLNLLPPQMEERALFFCMTHEGKLLFDELLQFHTTDKVTSENIAKWMLTLNDDKQRVAWLRAIYEEDRKESMRMLARYKGTTNKQAKDWQASYWRGVARLH